MKELNLSHTTVSDAGLEKLAALTQLQVLGLPETLVEGPGFASPRQSLKNLQELDISVARAWMTMPWRKSERSLRSSGCG